MGVSAGRGRKGSGGAARATFVDFSARTPTQLSPFEEEGVDAITSTFRDRFDSTPIY